MSNNKKWIVITSGERSINDISADLKRKGFIVDNVLEAIGQITGEGGEGIEKEAASIKGVISIVPSHDDIHIGDPDSAVTW